MKILACSSALIGLHAGALAIFYGMITGSLVLLRILLTTFAAFAVYHNFKSARPLEPLAMGSLCVCAALAFWQSAPDLLNFGHLFVLCLLYERPIAKQALRRLPYAKPFIIAYIWTMACAFPAWRDAASAAEAWMLPECFLYILGLAILFDIRDCERDRAAGIKTFAAEWGRPSAKGLGLACVFLSLPLLWRGLAEANFQRPGVIAGTLAFSSFIVALIPKPGSSEYVYLCLIDGLIGLKLAALLAV